MIRKRLPKNRDCPKGMIRSALGLLFDELKDVVEFEKDFLNSSVEGTRHKLKFSTLVFMLVRLNRLFKRQILRRERNVAILSIFEKRLVVTPDFKLMILPGKKMSKRVKCCDYCSRLYEINMRGTFMDLSEVKGKHFVPYSYILRRRRMAKRIVVFLSKFKTSKVRSLSYRRLLSDESTRFSVYLDGEKKESFYEFA